MTSYPFTLNPDKVRDYSRLTVKFRDFRANNGTSRRRSDRLRTWDDWRHDHWRRKFQFRPEENKAIEGQLPGSDAQIQSGRSACHHFLEHG